MKLYIVMFAVLVATLVVGCGSPAPPPAGPAPPPAAAPVPSVLPQGGEPPLEIVASTDDREALQTTARRLSGLEPGEGDAWTRHAERMEEIWTQVEGRHLEPMRSWAETELTLATPDAPLYYPFGGPDLLSALQFFPAASAYVLVGLEPPGQIPNLEGLAGDSLEAELERLRGGLTNLAEAGYFVTKRMETDFAATRRPEGASRSTLDGLLPVLYIFLARAGFTPTAVEFIHLDGEGMAVPLAAATDRTATAVRIKIADTSLTNERTLYYFSRDLSNAGLASAPTFVAFLHNLGSFNTYMKSASYLLHMDDFTMHNDFLAAQAGTVLQDDSGIPLRDLSSADWRLRYFGTYTRTLPTYNAWFQEDLAAVYQQAAKGTGIPALPFAIGYHSKIGGSCLIWAERK